MSGFRYTISYSPFLGRQKKQPETVININNTSKAKTMKDGIEYHFRTVPIADKDTTIKKVEESNPIIIKIPFHEEMFYGPDIRQCIALSVLYQLRQLKASGYRDQVLDDFGGANESQRVALLGNLIKTLYRIEGKSLVALRVSEQQSDSRLVCQSISDKNTKFAVDVENPEGDDNYFPDLSFHNTDARIAFLKDQIGRLDE
jgi:hypothetical protein